MPIMNEHKNCGNMVPVLRALIAYTQGQLPPYDCTPHGPGHEKDWVKRAEKLIDDHTRALEPLQEGAA